MHGLVGGVQSRVSCVAIASPMSLMATMAILKSSGVIVEKKKGFGPLSVSTDMVQFSIKYEHLMMSISGISVFFNTCSEM